MNKITMYLIRRKSDGKYWKNLTTARYHRALQEAYGEVSEEDVGWTDNRKECRLFDTKNGAMSSRIWVGRKIVPTGTRNCETCKEWGYLPSKERRHSSCTDWKVVKLTEEEMPYEIIPVVLYYK